MGNFMTHQKQKKKKENENENFMVKNGGLVSEEIISTSNGRCNLIRNFSANQLREATNNFESPAYAYIYDNWYRATLDGRPVLIKRYSGDDEYLSGEEACQDIALTSLMSSHSRVLKLLGCCLEVKCPALVYEDAEKGPLYNDASIIGPNNIFSPLPWKIRLKIAKGIAHALAYLHTAFSRPIIHRNVKPEQVFLDKDFVPKLTDFTHAISIPEGKTFVEDRVYGTQGFIDPHYSRTSVCSETTDVYSFGICLFILLAGRLPEDPLHVGQEKPWELIVDPFIMNEEGVVNEEQKLQDFLNLALRCIQIKIRDRPSMTDVAKELARIHSSTSTTT